MRYVCLICGYVYDDAKEEVPFEQLPDTWKCPICRASKSDFEPEELPAKAAGSASQGVAGESAEEGIEAEAPTEESIAAKTVQESASSAEDKDDNLKPGAEIGESDLMKLTPGQLSALCSNLARGCEKQYKEEESKLFRELADYFSKITPAVNDAGVEKVASLLQNDIASYKEMRAVADGASDRGAARVCVWGERVTRMLASLVGKYLNEGESMLADTDIWVCTVCGFVYVGDETPEICPVCKVPSWKFEKIEGRAK